jgi:hypothetical protein
LCPRSRKGIEPLDFPEERPGKIKREIGIAEPQDGTDTLWNAARRVTAAIYDSFRVPSARSLSCEPRTEDAKR